MLNLGILSEPWRMIWKQTSCSASSRLRRAHVRQHRSIDRLYAEGHLPEPASTEFLRWLHGELYRDAPEPMLWIENGDQVFRMEPGCFVFDPNTMLVGRQIPPSSGRRDELMRHFEQRYRLAGMGQRREDYRDGCLAPSPGPHSSLPRRQPK